MQATFLYVFLTLTSGSHAAGVAAACVYLSQMRTTEDRTTNQSKKAARIANASFADPRLVLYLASVATLFTAALPNSLNSIVSRELQQTGDLLTS